MYTVFWSRDRLLRDHIKSNVTPMRRLRFRGKSEKWLTLIRGKTSTMRSLILIAYTLNLRDPFLC